MMLGEERKKSYLWLRRRYSRSEISKFIWNFAH